MKRLVEDRFTVSLFGFLDERPHLVVAELGRDDLNIVERERLLVAEADRQVVLATSAALAGVVDQPVSVPTVGELAAGAGAGALIVLALASLGFVLALVARSVLVGVVVGVGWVIGVEVLLLSMLSPVAGWVDVLRGVLPAGAAGSVAAGAGAGPELELASTVGVTALLPVPASLLVLGCWTVVCVVSAVMVFQRRDLR